MGKYSFSQLEAIWVQAGGSAVFKAMAAAVAMAESGGNPNASNRNSNGTTDRGLWQINSIHGSQSTFDPISNARAAVSISKNGTNWRPWCTAWSTGRCSGTFLGQGSPVLKYLPGGSSTGTAAIGAAAANALASATAAMRAIAAAKTQIGVPYKFDTESPNKSFDCSGLTAWAYSKAGIRLPHNAAQQQAMTTPVTRAQAQPGDLVFYGTPAHHVGIYLGAGKYLEAPHTGAKVKITGIGNASDINFGRVTGSGAGNPNSNPIQTTPVFGIPNLNGIENALSPEHWFDALVKPMLLKVAYIGEIGIGVGLMLFGVWALIRSSDTYKNAENVVTGTVSGTKVRQTSSDKRAAQTARKMANAETKEATKPQPPTNPPSGGPPPATAPVKPPVDELAAKRAQRQQSGPKRRAVR